MAQPALDVFHPVFALLENLRVRLKFNERAVRLLCLAGVFLFQFAGLELRLRKLAVAMAPRQEELGQCVHRLGADAV